MPFFLGVSFFRHSIIPYSLALDEVSSVRQVFEFGTELESNPVSVFCCFFLLCLNPMSTSAPPEHIIHLFYIFLNLLFGEFVRSSNNILKNIFLITVDFIKLSHRQLPKLP